MIDRSSGFKKVIAAVGQRPEQGASQNATRHYSEKFSKEVALWLREKIIQLDVGNQVLPPEGKVDTIYGIGNRGKSLDVGVLDIRRYLLLNISIKTFNFKDRQTNNYRHNYTGRFYELLGEDLDLRRSYSHATLVALILIPADSTDDSDPSSFAHAVRQFSKIAKKDRSAAELGFEFVFVGVHSPKGDIYFFDASNSPPRIGSPSKNAQLSINEMLAEVLTMVEERRALTETSPLPVYVPYNFSEPIDSDS